MFGLNKLSPLFPSFVIVLLSCLVLSINATTIDIFNNCPYTVWPAASPGGGKQLNQGETWSINPPDGTKMARIWPRTGCNFDGNGNGHCDTGDCGGILQCSAWGTDPQTLVEYTLAQPDNPNDTIDMSLIEGFNVPVAFTPTSNTGGTCRDIRCTADIVGQCPAELQTKGGCNNPCTVYPTEVKYCCSSVRGSCGPTDLSNYFKTRCPDAYSYPQDDPSSTFACPHGTNYKLTFCP